MMLLLASIVFIGVSVSVLAFAIVLVTCMLLNEEP
jgi:hypothetical protein